MTANVQRLAAVLVFRVGSAGTEDEQKTADEMYKSSIEKVKPGLR